jgi:hypothetical protein
VLCKNPNAEPIRQALKQLVPGYGDGIDSEPPPRPSQAYRESKPMEIA